MGFKGFRTTENGMLYATLGKTLVKSAKFTGLELKKGLKFLTPCQEITFAKVPSPMTLYIDNKISDNALSIEDVMSLEAEIKVFYLQSDIANDEDKFEIWIWR